MKTNIKKVALFIILTFSCNWLMALLFFALGGQTFTPVWFIMGIIYMFVPMVIAIFVQLFIYKEPIQEPLGISFKVNRWFLIAWLLPPAIAFATITISLIMPTVKLSVDPEGTRMFEHFQAFLPPELLEKTQEKLSTSWIHPIWIGLISGLFAGITVNAIAAFGEELGWRGFLQRQLAPMGFWTSSLFIGLIWGIWHAPLVLRGHNYPQHPVVGVFMMAVFCMLLGPIFSCIRIRAQSVIAAAIAHGSLNATAALPLVTLKGGTDLTVGVTGLAGFVVLATINIALFAYYRFHREKFDCLFSQPMVFRSSPG